MPSPKEQQRLSSSSYLSSLVIEDSTPGLYEIIIGLIAAASTSSWKTLKIVARYVCTRNSALDIEFSRPCNSKFLLVILREISEEEAARGRRDKSERAASCYCFRFCKMADENGSIKRQSRHELLSLLSKDSREDGAAAIGASNSLL